MKSRFKFIQQMAVYALLLILGVVIGYRYLQPGQLPWLDQAPNPLAGMLGNGDDIRLGPGEAGSGMQFRLLNTDQPDEFKNVDFSEFWDVWRLLERDYLDPEKINQEDLVYGAIQGMTAAVGDPYTVFLPPEEDKRAAEDLAGSFYGVGIELGYIDGILAVVAPLKGMPADLAGVQAGDLILHVNDERKNLDEDTTNWSLSEAVDKIRGERNTSVTLTLARENATPPVFDITIERDEIVIPSVELEYVEHNGKRVAHIILYRFGERTADEWDAAVADIRNQQPDAVLLDMRNNPGGYFEDAIDVVSEFVRSGVVVTQQGRVTNRDYRVRGIPMLSEYDLAILVNRGSASASEIVAGALRDLKGSQLVGENTFGKGTVQDRRQLDKGGGIHITIARWLLPNGGWIHEEGLPVDVEVSNDPETEQDEVVLRAVEAL